MEIRIRKGTLEDVKGITETHRSGIEEWYHYADGRRTIKSTYGELSILERYLHGGPWMSVESCAVHINSLLLDGNTAIVAEAGGKIVGEAELFISEEPVDGEPRRIAHLDVIEVHKDFRRRGIGKALIGFSEEIAGEKGCDMLTVTPDKGAMGFYEKLGIKKIIHRGVMVDFSLEGFPSGGAEIRIGDFKWDEIQRKEMVLGKFQSSYDHWFTAFRDRIAGVDDRLYFESGRFNKTHYVLESSFFGGDIATAYAWGGDVAGALLIIGSRAGELGFRRLRTIIREEDINSVKSLNPSITGRSVILAKML
ncbi:N-acetyltransferase family protein [Thermococcus sp.]